MHTSFETGAGYGTFLQFKETTPESRCVRTQKAAKIYWRQPDYFCHSLDRLKMSKHF
jgi:hypothetical protein